MAFSRTKTGCARVREQPTALLVALVALAALGCEYPSEGPVLVRATPAGVAGSAAAPSPCDDPQNLVCLDFEDSSLAVPTLTLMTATGTSEYDATSSGGGQQSLRISVAAEANYVVEVQAAAPVTTGQLYLRGLFRLPNAVEPGSYVVLMEALDAQAAAKVSFDWRPADFGLNASGQTSYAMQALPREAWFCAELAIDVAATSGAARLSLDGAQSVELTMANTLLGTGLSRFRVGINGGVGNPALQVNVDDFVVRTTAIGCP